MKLFKNFFLGGALFLGGLAQAQVSLSFQTSFDCGKNQYCADVVIAGTNNGEAIGTSSVYITYNSAALHFNNYTSKAFDNVHLCPGENLARYDAHQYDALNPGILNTTLVLGQNGTGCPALDVSGTAIATVCFDIINADASSQLQFSHKHTQFNKSVDNITLLSDLSFFDKDESLDCKTSGIGNISADDALISLSPNPATEQLIALYQAQDGIAKGSVKVYSVSGQEMLNLTPAIAKGPNNLLIPTKSLPVGMYILTIEDKGGKHSIRFIKN